MVTKTMITSSHRTVAYDICRHIGCLSWLGAEDLPRRATGARIAPTHQTGDGYSVAENGSTAADESGAPQELAEVGIRKLMGPGDLEGGA